LVILPPALRSIDETNPFLKRYKASREDKIVLTRRRSLWDVSDLLFYYLALRRWLEAIETSDFIIDNVKLPQPYVAMKWIPVCDAIRVKHFCLYEP